MIKPFAAWAAVFVLLGCFTVQENTGIDAGPKKDTLYLDNLGLFLFYQDKGLNREMVLSNFGDSIYRALDTHLVSIDSVRDSSIEFNYGYWVKTVFIKPGTKPEGWEARSEEKQNYNREFFKEAPDSWLVCFPTGDSLQEYHVRKDSAQTVFTWSWTLKYVDGKGIMLSMPMQSHNGNAMFDNPLPTLSRPMEGKLRIIYWK